MKILNLPQQIQNRVFELQIQSKNKPNVELDLITKKSQGNFNWHSAVEGWEFWLAINEGDFTQFSITYPHGVKDPRITAKDVADKILKEAPIVLSDHSYDAMHEHICRVLETVLL